MWSSAGAFTCVWSLPCETHHQHVMLVPSKSSPSGNWTPVSRVTGGDTHHYTNEDTYFVITCLDFLFLPSMQLGCHQAQIQAVPSHTTSRVAQWKRAGPITQRSVDRNHALLTLFFLRTNFLGLFSLQRAPLQHRGSQTERPDQLAKYTSSQTGNRTPAAAVRAPNPNH